MKRAHLKAKSILRRSYHLIARGSAQWVFPGSRTYWEERYAKGGNSGAGSYGHLAEFKADVLNRFVRDHSICSVIEFGCGDGNQLMLSRYPKYEGFDVSATAIRLCRRKFINDITKEFFPVGAYKGQRAELSLSLDVIYHLVEDSTFEEYMSTLFGAATRYVAIYSSNTNEAVGGTVPHIKHRNFSNWIEKNCPHWVLKLTIRNRYSGDGSDSQSSFADFYIYENTFIKKID